MADLPDLKVVETWTEKLNRLASKSLFMALLGVGVGYKTVIGATQVAQEIAGLAVIAIVCSAYCVSEGVRRAGEGNGKG